MSWAKAGDAEIIAAVNAVIEETYERIIAGRKPRIDIIISRHKALVDYVKKAFPGYIGEDLEVIEHITPENKEKIIGKRVLGNLPMELAALAAEVTVIPLALPRELRGKELTLDEVRCHAGTPTTFKVSPTEQPWPRLCCCGSGFPWEVCRADSPECG